jgi:hypothetical protein
MDAVPAAVGDVAQFLDVDVHELAGVVVFVAAHPLTGGAVEVGQASDPVAGQDAVHGGGGDAEQEPDAGGSPPAQDPDFDDASFGAGRSLVWAVVWAGGAVVHASGPVLAEPVGPAGRGADRDLEPLRGLAQRPAVLDDAAGQPLTPERGQRGVTVEHEGLLGRCRCRNPHRTWRPSLTSRSSDSRRP